MAVFSFFACPVAENVCSNWLDLVCQGQSTPQNLFPAGSWQPRRDWSIQLAALQGRCQVSWQSRWDAASPAAHGQDHASSKHFPVLEMRSWFDIFVAWGN